MTSDAVGAMNTKIKWDILAGIVIVHLGALFAPFYFTWPAFWLFIVLQFATGLGVTVCYHRLLTHRSFHVPKWVEYPLTLCGMLALQGGPLKWVATHRVHHAFSDRPNDPHSPTKGFWWAHVLWLFVPTLLLALIQSYRLFRIQPQDGVPWMLRCVLPLVAVTILWSFSATAGFVASQWEPFTETREALDKLQSGAAKIEVSGEDLAKGSTLTAPTRRWLRGSKILVARDSAHLPGYLATIRLASGTECRLTVARSGGSAATCVQ